MPEPLEMLPIDSYIGVNKNDPIRFYDYPVIGRLYKRRVELCLSELKPGNRILEVGFGSGVTFLNLNRKYKEICGVDLSADAAGISSVFTNMGINVCLKNGSILDMPFPDGHFDAVLLISILEHLAPQEQDRAFSEISRVLASGGQVVYGVPVERKLMKFLFRLMGYSIEAHHLSSEKEVFASADKILKRHNIVKMNAGVLGCIYEVGHFIKR